MANSYLDVKTIAADALPVLADEMAMLPLVYRGVDKEFGSPKQKGNVVQIEKPQVFSTVDGSGDITGSFQDITESSVDVTLNIERSVPIQITAKDLTLSAKDFKNKYTKGAVAALGAYVNNALLGLYKDIPYFSGTSGVTPSTLANMADARLVLQDNKAPANMRSFVMNNTAESKFLALDSLAEVDKAGTNTALRNASIGRVYNMGLFSDGQVNTHIAGLFTALADVTGAGTIDTNSLVLTSAAGASTATLLKGDLILHDGYQYVVTATSAAAVSGVVTAAVYPALKSTTTTEAATFPDVTAGAHVNNLMFQKNAFCLAMAPLAPPIGGAQGAVMSARGLSISVVMDYDVYTKTNIMRYDILFGVKTIYPELAVRVLG